MARPRKDQTIQKLFEGLGLMSQSEVAVALKRAGFFRDRSRAAVGTYLSKVEAGVLYTCEELLAGITTITDSDPRILDYYTARMKLWDLEEIEPSHIEFKELLDEAYI